MFKPVNKSELGQISLTGLRAIVMIGLLIDYPRSLEEIREAFVKLNVMEPDHSNDILRIDLNTLRAMGCEITRADNRTGYKYCLVKHPYSLDIKMEEVAVLKKAFKKIKATGDIKLMLKYDELFKKLSGYICDENVKQALYGISVMKHFQPDFVSKLIDDCKNKKILKLVYEKSAGKEESVKEIHLQDLVFQNDKVYLYGFDLNRNKQTVLNIAKIKAIIGRYTSDDKIKIEYTNVKFLLKNTSLVDIEENEKIIETREDSRVIVGKYYNEFLAAQRILSFGADCTVLEPEDFREIIIEKLKSMRRVYND